MDTLHEYGQRKYVLEQLLPTQFYLDNTLARYPHIDCPRCLARKCNMNHMGNLDSGSPAGNVVGVVYFDDVNRRMSLYLGCKECHFRWLRGTGKGPHKV